MIFIVLYVLLVQSVTQITPTLALLQGFGVENIADAVFLDLPKPWGALDTAKRALKKLGV